MVNKKYEYEYEYMCVPSVRKQVVVSFSHVSLKEMVKVDYYYYYYCYYLYYCYHYYFMFSLASHPIFFFFFYVTVNNYNSSFFPFYGFHIRSPLNIYFHAIVLLCFMVDFSQSVSLSESQLVS